VTWVRSFRTCERIEHKHEHEHEHEHEIRVGAQYVSHAARAKLPETNMNMNTNTRKEQGLRYFSPGCNVHACAASCAGNAVRGMSRKCVVGCAGNMTSRLP